MWRDWLSRVAICLAVVGAATPLHSQADILRLWASVGKDESGVVFFIPANVSYVAIRDEAGRVLDEAKMPSGLPFIKHYRLSPGEYQVRLAGPIQGVTIEAHPG